MQKYGSNKSGIKWKSETCYVDIDTGEIIGKEYIKNGDYRIIKTNKTVEYNEERIKYTRECIRTGQERLF
jgi:hypothetical protein